MPERREVSERKQLNGYAVYKYTFPDGKIYIGTTKNTIQGRRNCGYQHNAYLKDVAKTVGWENVKTEILDSGLSQAEAFEREQYYIAMMKSNNPDIGVNISNGGKSTFKGLKHTEEAKNKCRMAHIGKAFSEEHRRNLSIAHKGLMVGEKNPLYGIPKSDETIRKQYISHSAEMKPIIQKDVNGNVVGTYFSMHEAERKTGVNRNNIRECANGKRKYSKGFSWEYGNVRDVPLTSDCVSV